MRTEQCQWLAATGWSPRPPGTLGASAQLVLLLGDAGLATAARLQELSKAFCNAHLFGCSTAGEVQDTALRDGTLAVTAIAFDHTEVAAARAPITGPNDGFEAGALAVASLPAHGLRHAFVLAPGNYIHGGHLVRGLNSALPQGASVSGGFAGAGGQVHGSSVWCDGEPECSAVVAVGFYGPRFKAGLGMGAGWSRFGPERLITKSDGVTVYEFDGRSALGLYKQYLGEYADGLPFTALRFPLGLRARGSDCWNVQVIVGIDELNGGLRFDCDIPERSHASFMVGNAERLAEGALAAARTSCDELGSPAELSILVSCYGRRYVLGQQTERELEVVREVLGGGTTIAGFYSYGEISASRPGAPSELYNQSITLTSIAES